MKTHNLVTISLLAFFGGCTNSNTPSESGIETTDRIVSISGKIESWSYGGDYIIALAYPDSSQSLRKCTYSHIDSLGRFSIANFPSLPLSVRGFAVYPSIGSNSQVLENTFSCSDSSATMIWGELLVAKDTTSSWSGSVLQSTYSPDSSMKSGDFNVAYCFVMKDVILSGTIRTKVYSAADNTEFEFCFHYNLSFKKGWNKEVFTLIDHATYADSGTKYSKTEGSFTDSEPFQGHWYLTKF